MERIELVDALPAVFAPDGGAGSQVWRREVGLLRGGSYLLSAASGAGKSSLCGYIFGCRRDYTGRIAFDGTDISTLSQKQWRETRLRHIAYLPQDMMLFPELTALENVELKNRLTRHKTGAQIMSLFEELGVADRAHSLAGQISIGQQQRVAIIRTLCQPFDFIMLDEPVSHLDPASNAAAAAVIAREARERGAGIIATSVGNDMGLTFDTRLRL